MTAYVISEVEILDHDLADSYRTLAAASIEKHGGRYLVRGGASELVEGQPAPKNLIIVAFPTMEFAKAWYRSPEYTAALTIRARALDRRLIFVEGV
jgi:uncharacterized protein (DUF1330 family)